MAQDADTQKNDHADSEEVNTRKIFHDDMGPFCNINYRFPKSTRDKLKYVAYSAKVPPAWFLYEIIERAYEKRIRLEEGGE